MSTYCEMAILLLLMEWMWMFKLQYNISKWKVNVSRVAMLSNCSDCNINGDA